MCSLVVFVVLPATVSAATTATAALLLLGHVDPDRAAIQLALVESGNGLLSGAIISKRDKTEAA